MDKSMTLIVPLNVFKKQANKHLIEPVKTASEPGSIQRRRS